MKLGKPAFGFTSALLVSLAAASSVPSHTLYLKIYRHQPQRLADEPIGYVPVDPAKPVPIAEHGLFYIRVLGDLKSFTVQRLVEVLSQRKLKGLDLSLQSEFNDKDCEALNVLTDLSYLNLAGTAATDTGIAALGGLRHLKTLVLGERSTDAAVQKINHFEDLENLTLTAAAISDAGLARLDHKHLQRVELGTSITDAGLKGLTHFHGLRHLDLGATHMTDAGVSSLGAFPDLDTLLMGRELSSAGLITLAELPALHHSLKRLDLSNTRVNDQALGTLALFENLEEIGLTGTSIGDTALRRLSHVKRLRALELSETLMTGAGLDQLSTLPNLEVLSISLSDHLSVADLQPLRRMPKLRLLIVNGSPVTGTRLKQLMTKLHALEGVPTGSSGSSSSTAEIIAYFGTTRPGLGLHRLDGSSLDAGLPLPEENANYNLVAS